ncbi:MAG: PEP-CTERM sorting domain-containing protein [Microcystis aeruginosa W13-11]|nr:PEP-CTERM sorting domain-containing protein [Microcystis aeruginosa W13-11]
MQKSSILGLVSGIALATLGMASAVQAAIITVPTGLNPGDKYRLVFVTSGFRDAQSSDIADYNTFVTNQVTPTSALGLSLTASGLNPTWTAIGSTATVNAKTNTLTDPVANASTSVPIYLIDGNKVATRYGDLWDGQILTPISTSDDGQKLGEAVWTGTNSVGNGANVLGSGNVNFGTSNDSTSGWVEEAYLMSGYYFRLYGMSSVLTVPQAQPQSVPEPSSILGYITLGGLMLGGAIRRAKK